MKSKIISIKCFIFLLMTCFSFTNAYSQEAVTSVSYEGCEATGKSILSGSELIDNLSYEQAKSAKQYNDIAKNKIRGYCELKVTLINGEKIKSSPPQVKSVSFTGCDVIGKSTLTDDELKEGLTIEDAKSATQYNDIAKNKIRGYCELQVTSINGNSLQPKPTCRYTTDISITELKLRKFASNEATCSSTGCLPYNLYICRGTALCEDDPAYGSDTYNVTCLSQTEGECPGVKECMNDEFTVPHQDIKSSKIIKDIQKSSRGIKQ